MEAHEKEDVSQKNKPRFQVMAHAATPIVTLLDSSTPLIKDMRNEPLYSNLFKVSKPGPTLSKQPQDEKDQRDESLNAQVNQILQLDGSKTIQSISASPFMVLKDNTFANTKT